MRVWMRLFWSLSLIGGLAACGNSGADGQNATGTAQAAVQSGTATTQASLVSATGTALAAQLSSFQATFTAQASQKQSGVQATPIAATGGNASLASPALILTATTASTATPVPPSPTPTIAPTATLAPTATPAPKPGDVLYQADWSNSPKGWANASGWKIAGGMYLNDGTAATGAAWVNVPWENNGVADYAVEWEMQVSQVGRSNCINGSQVGIVGRTDNTGYYFVGMQYWINTSTPYAHIKEVSKSIQDDCYQVSDAGADKGYDPKAAWHTYRAEFKGNTIRLLVDGTLVVTTSDNHHVTSGGIGLWCLSDQVNVRAFKVIAL